MRWGYKNPRQQYFNRLPLFIPVGWGYLLSQFFLGSLYNRRDNYYYLNDVYKRDYGDYTINGDEYMNNLIGNGFFN
jgi:hypothetical protein